MENTKYERVFFEKITRAYRKNNSLIFGEFQNEWGVGRKFSNFERFKNEDFAKDFLGLSLPSWVTSKSKLRLNC